MTCIEPRSTLVSLLSASAGVGGRRVGLILAPLALLGHPALVAAQDLSKMPQQSVLDGPTTRTTVPARAPTPTQAQAPVPMVSNPVVQPIPTVSRPVVQPVPVNNGGGQALNTALARLARDPRNVEALLDAGNAAMALGDMDAALGFFRRADEAGPGNGAVKAQIGKAMLRTNDPLAAIAAFSDAERAGADQGAMAADRGLAYDLVGDNQLAQRYYHQALAKGPDAEVTRRLALSMAIAGDRAGAEKVLAPQLAGADRGAWRVRTFILAIAGNPDEAVAVANTSMPPQLAAGIAPYLRYLTRLTPAQQAAAANFGRFPRAADIGRDEPQIAAYALAHPRPAHAELAQADTTPPVPQGRKERGQKGRAARTAAAPVTPAPAPVFAQAAPPPPPPVSTVVTPAPVPAQAMAQPTLPPPPPAATPVPAPVAVPVPVQAPPPPPPAQGVQLATLPPSGPAGAVPPPPAPQPAAQAPAATPSPADFAALFAGFAAPAEEGQRQVVAVDLVAVQAANERAAAEKAAVEARKAAEAKKQADAKKAAADRKALAEKKLADAKKAEEARKAKEEAKRLAANPSRTWVQVLTGGDRAKMGKEWAGLQAKSSDLKGRKAYVTPWNRVYRLVTGPFPSDAAAQEFVAKLKRNNVSAFQFDSPAGQAMDGVTAK